jgi:hypothetical protein
MPAHATARHYRVSPTYPPCSLCGLICTVVGNIVLFNAPRIFAALWSTAKAFMDPITAAKVEVYSGVPTERLTQLIGKETLLCEYGGLNATDYPKMVKYTKPSAK